MIPTNSKDSTVTHHEKSVHLTSQVYHKFISIIDLYLKSLLNSSIGKKADQYIVICDKNKTVYDRIKTMVLWKWIA